MIRLLSSDAISRLLVDPVPLISCEEFFDHLDTYAEARSRGANGVNGVNGANDPSLDGHVRGCRGCAEETDSLIALLRRQA